MMFLSTIAIILALGICMIEELKMPAQNDEDEDEDE